VAEEESDLILVAIWILVWTLDHPGSFYH